MVNGTQGRKWHTDQKNNIAFSFIVKSDCNVEKLEGLTIEIVETILQVFKKVYHIELQIKKPNDIIFNGKKIGGILTEIKSNKGFAKYIVIGIGINTNQQVFPKEIENIATSIIKEFQTEVDREKIIFEFYNLFEQKIIKRLGA